MSKGLPKKYAKMGFKAGWIAFKKTPAYKKVKKTSKGKSIAKRSSKKGSKMAKKNGNGKGLSFGVGRRKHIGVVEVIGLLGAIDQMYNFANTPLAPLNGIANVGGEAAKTVLRSFGMTPSPLSTALVSLGGSQILKKASKQSGLNPYVKWSDLKIELI